MGREGEGEGRRLQLCHRRPQTNTYLLIKMEIL